MENRITFFRFNITNSTYSGRVPASHYLDFTRLKKNEERLTEVNRSLENWQGDTHEVRYKSQRISGTEVVVEFERVLRRLLTKQTIKKPEELFDEITAFVYNPGEHIEDGFYEYTSRKERWILEEDRLELSKGKLSLLDWKKFPLHEELLDIIQKLEKEFHYSLDALHRIVDSINEAENKKEQMLSELPELEKKIKKHKQALVNGYTETQRIKEDDIANLNAEIERMNQEGWSVKQIEGINSGMRSVSTSFSHPTEGGGGAGWGYGFAYTEGVMVVWERKENK